MSKKLIRNILVLSLAAVILVTATVFTTIAYLISTAKVSNVFTVGEVAIEMYESVLTSDGKAPLNDDPNAKKTADSNSYSILPGETYWKDPTVYIKGGSKDTILFVKARNQISNIEIPADNTQGLKTMRQQMEENGWRRVAKTSIGDYIYVYAGSGVITDGNDNTFGSVIPTSNDTTSIDLFQTFTIDPNCNTDAYKLAQGAAVTITAYAIQGSSFCEDNVVTKQNVVDAWNAIVGKVDYETGNTITLNDIDAVNGVVNP
jgi:hypothetical protein